MERLDIRHKSVDTEKIRLLLGLINIYINQKMGLGPWGRWAVGFDIITYKYLFIFYFFIFETMHLSERLQTFRKVALWFINSSKDSDRRVVCFSVLPGILNNSYIHFRERKTVEEFG